MYYILNYYLIISFKINWQFNVVSESWIQEKFKSDMVSKFSFALRYVYFLSSSNLYVRSKRDTYKVEF